MPTSNGSTPCTIWLTGGVAYKFVLTDSNGVAVGPTFDNVTGINDPAVSSVTDQWVVFTGTPTYISATSFSVSGDQTGVFQVGRRVKTANSGGTVYSTVLASAFGAVTTVTVVNDSSTLDAGLSQVSYGFLSALQSSVPGNYAMQNGTTVSGNGLTAIDFTGLPSWTRMIILGISSLSSSGTSNWILQIGDSGGIEIAGYVGGAATYAAGSTTAVNSTTAFPITGTVTAANIISGVVTLTLVDPSLQTWACAVNVAYSDTPATATGAGAKALSGVLDRIRLTTAGGVNTFDAAGARVNILYM